MNRIVVLGGTGFVGRAVCEQLQSALKAGGPLAAARIVVPSRRRERGKHLFPLPQVDVVAADVHQEADLTAVLRGADVVINLIAILHGTPQAFEQVHVMLPQRVAAACRAAGVQRLVHVSALGVPEQAAQAPSNYLRSKALGEAALKASGVPLVILRPSVIFGEHDRFLNLFAQLLRLAPVMPLAGAHARFQPVWVEDVARAVVRAVTDPTLVGQTYELGGPQVLTLADLVRLAGRASGHPRPVLPVPMAVGRLQAAVLACLPGEPPMSPDNLDSMKVDNVLSGRLPGLRELGIEPASVELIAPGYLGQQTPSLARQLDAWRMRARR